MQALIRYQTKDRIKLLASKLKFWLSQKPALIIYTMAKVGSLSVYTSIKKQTTIPCFHLHSLNVEEEKAAQQICFENGLVPDSRSAVWFVQNRIIIPKKEVKLITLFRNPIERNISAFFDAFELYVGVPIEKYKGDIESLIQIYHEKLPHCYVIEWFEQIFERDTGINVYSNRFNKENGFQQFSQDNYSVLILNSAIDNSLKEELISRFIDADSFVLKNENITSESIGGELYNDFKNTIKFNKAHLDTLLKSNYCQHFFTKNEIDASYKRWLE